MGKTSDGWEGNEEDVSVKQVAVYSKENHKRMNRVGFL